MASSDELLAQLRADISDERVLAAIAAVPRELFVAPGQAAEAWSNIPLPIGAGQTISQPLVVARMLELLELCGDERVLDVGTGSGYHAALLAQLGARVWSVERHAALSALARSNLEAAGIENVELSVGDGALGLPGEAPFDAINVAAATRPGRLAALEQQLAPGGRLVAPIVTHDQHLVLVIRDEDGRITRERHERVRFVPLI